MSNLLSAIQKNARELGFDSCGVTQSYDPKHGEYFKSWLSEKRYGEMAYLAKNQDKRLQPNLLMEQTASILVLGTSYHHNQGQDKDFKMARYAQGADYHHWIKDRLELLSKQIKDELIPEFEWRSFVDTGPILERDLASKAGLGWVGKNSCVIDTKLGSYVFLSVILCNVELGDGTIGADHCGTCQRCIEACPTEALTPYQLNASRCLAYHNIEKRGERDPAFYESIGSWIVGCDICQEVCPWNDKAPLSRNEDWMNGFKESEFDSLESILEITPTQFKKRYKMTPLSRIKYIDFMRNTFIVIANLKRIDLLDPLHSWAKRHGPELPKEWDHCVKTLTVG